MKRYSIILLLAFLFAACDSNRVFEEYYDFQEKNWNLDTIPAFNFTIDNSDPKNVFINLRNTISYSYQNLYLNFQLLDDSGNELKTELINIQVFDEKTGKPFGKGSSIYEHEYQILKDFSFPKVGNYTLYIAQYMREINLKEIVSIGTRIESTN